MTTAQVREQPGGLTEAEAAQRHARGEGNTATAGTSRSYRAILRANVFTLFNNLLFGIGVALLLLDRTNDAVISVGLGLINSVISSGQEIRAKRKLDQLKVLHRGSSQVVRDGTERAVPPERVVRGDLVHLRPGDQIVVDGPLVTAGRLECDESLLTGESEPVVKQEGDLLLSGSSCLAGDGFQRAEAVGPASHAHDLTVVARGWTSEPTPLQRRINQIVRAVMLVVALLSITILVQAAINDLSFLQIVKDAAVLSGLIPYGLFLLVAVAYATGAAAVAARGALVQRVNAVEALSNVDVLCTDKTGTLTTGKLQLDRVIPVGAGAAADVPPMLGSFARSVSAGNATTTALAEALAGTAFPVSQEVPFSSARRWSAISGERQYVLGALDRLAPQLGSGAPEPLRGEAAGWTSRGYRVLLFAEASDPGHSLFDAAGTPRLPPLRALALVVLRDELRPHVEQVLREMRDTGVRVKVVSGDDPGTVAALAAQVGLPGTAPISGDELDELSPAEFDRAVQERSVFGRIAPGQKHRIVDSLRRQGHYTVMIGDGVNDIPSLKRAHIGVAMQSGSAVTRDIADLVLLGDSFSALTAAQHQGRRIISGIGTSLNLFLARVATSTLIIIAVAVLGLGFPYEPAQVALTLFTVGLPTFFLTRWAPPRRFDPRMVSSLARFVGPASLVTAAFAVAIYAVVHELVEVGIGRSAVPAEVLQKFSAYTGVSGTDAGFADAAATVTAQTALSTFTAVTAFVLILFLAPPWRFFAGWTEPVTDKRPALLALGLFTVFVVVLVIPPAANYFALLPPYKVLAPLILIAVPMWFFVLRGMWRHRLLERALDL
ncbi:HAD-IC family P-type ATPase [Actinoplanes sp. CA-051413]|uniref:HAD-IC family P-type ATPase n=1 Tax=Actinoplanes sp. CA-051413 TaxID=3239899 RepID=UPI003D973EFA